MKKKDLIVALAETNLKERAASLALVSTLKDRLLESIDALDTDRGLHQEICFEMRQEIEQLKAELKACNEA